MLFEIWQSRNNLKHEHQLLPQQTIIEKVNAQLNNILQIQYKKHKLQETTSAYTKQWQRSKIIY